MTAATEARPPASAAGEAAGPTARSIPVVFESRGWSASSEPCDPKISALAALASVPAPAAVPSVSYVSRGNALVISGADAARARAAATQLSHDLHVTLLAGDPGPVVAGVTAWSGALESLTGHLGEFTANIVLTRAPKATPARFDLVLDLGDSPALPMRMPPQGYFRAHDDSSLAPIVDEMRGAVGEFEKPRFFNYRENLCAHSRSEIEGCSACIEICSTQAIRADGDKVAVDPHLCMGCGACATVCPTGAMGFQFPRPEERGAQMRQLLGAYRSAGGRDACVVFHEAGAIDLLESAAAAGEGLPARALPLQTWSVASTGLDLMLPAIAYGASQVVVLATGQEDAEYLAALDGQMAIGQAVLSALGLEGRHFAVVRASDAASLASGFAGLPPASGVAVPAAFALSNDKRTAIEFAIEHLVKHAPRKVEAVPLPQGAPYGQVMVDQAKCTMCMSCVGACPASALMDGGDRPMLKFLERNCVQCGLCESTCPEGAIQLQPRLLLTPAVRETRVLNETQPFHCVRCQKPFGTRQMVEAMMGRLAGHSMFAGGGAMKRLQMCADCRVVDMMESKSEASILTLGGNP